MKTRIYLMLILILAAALRFTGLNWDENTHLHPDERYLTMVATAVKLPDSLGEYFDPQTSRLSPYNSGYGAYIYGLLPLNWVKFWGVQLGMDGYNSLTLLGRFWSAAFSLGAVYFVFLLGRKVFGIRAGLAAAFLVATNVLFIQSAHFWTMESFLVFFTLLTFWFLLKIIEHGAWKHYLLAGVGIGLAMACKLNAVFLLGIAGLAGLLDLYRSKKSNKTNISPQALWQTAGKLAGLGLTAYFVFRLLNPYIFKNAGFLDLSLREDFLQAFKFQLQAIKGVIMYPPQYQWVNTMAYLFPLKNLALWGLGLPTFMLAVGGVIWAVGSSRTGLTNFSLLSPVNTLKPALPAESAGGRVSPVSRTISSGVFLMLFWTLGLFMYQGRTFVKSMRYLIPLVPFLLILGGYFMIRLFEAVEPHGLTPVAFSRRRVKKAAKPVRSAAVIALSCFLLSSFLYSLAFVSIYTRPTTRVAASHWLYKNIPAGSIILNEHWDDSLPLSLPGENRNYQMPQLEVYRADDARKAAYLAEELGKADFLVLSSARASGSIGKLSEQFPIMSRYYKLLFEEKLGFIKVAEFTSYPQLFGIKLNDDSAEELFTVYDHPKVVIFRKKDLVDYAALLQT